MLQMISLDNVDLKDAKIAYATMDFFSYCNLKAPDFYQEDRGFLVSVCNDFQSFYESDEDVLVLNMPPRHGKSRTAGCFVEWALGNNQNEKIMLGSYNEALSTTFSKNVRDTITEQKGDDDKIVYSDIFPGVTIKYGDSAMNKWSLENGYNNYLATSPKGTSTGFGATLMIIDDLIKSALEANNADVLEQQWTWFTDTMMSRLEEGGKIIIIMTRWHSDDLAGRALRHFRKLGMKVRHICYKALQDDGTMLCKQILSRRSYEIKTKSMSKEIAAANYQQEPIDIKGRLYTKFKTYTKLPVDENGNPLYTKVKNYTDTADTGDDFLCSIDYVEYNKEAYIINVIYTKEPMETTEPAVAKMLYDDGVNEADIESNNGGRGFSRSVERILQEEMNSNKCIINPFFQNKNKIARIISNSTWVMNHIYFPVNWADKFPDYYDAMSRYQKEGKNAHDDAPDATTGIAEKISQGDTFSFD